MMNLEYDEIVIRWKFVHNKKVDKNSGENHYKFFVFDAFINNLILVTIDARFFF